jgi:hypothetical protein
VKTLLIIVFNVSAHGNALKGPPPDGYLGGGLPVGEGLWIFITLIFSFALNFYLRKWEH